MDPLTRGLRFMWRVADASADEIVTLRAGTALRTPSLVDAWSVNALRVERAAPDLTLDDAAVLAAAHAAVPYRYVLVEEEQTALRLAAAARRAGGWTVATEVVMALGGAPATPRAGVREGTFAEILALFARWLAEEGHSERTIDHLCTRRRREHAFADERLLVADHDGAAAAMATVRVGDGVTQIEDVYAVPEARGTGLGQAVTAAGARVGAERGGTVVIVADDEDWPKQLYARIGFAGLGRRTQLHLSA